MKALPAGKQQLPLRQRVPPVTLQSHRSPFYGVNTFAEFTLKVPLNSIKSCDLYGLFTRFPVPFEG